MQELNNKTFTFYHKVKTQGRVPVEMNRSLFYLHPNTRFCFGLKDELTLKDHEFSNSTNINQQKILQTFAKAHSKDHFLYESNPEGIWNPKHENKRKISKEQHIEWEKLRVQQISNGKIDFIEYLSVMFIFAFMIILKLVFDTYLSFLVGYFIRKKDKFYMLNPSIEYNKDLQVFLIQENDTGVNNIEKTQQQLLDDIPPDKFAAIVN
ncbi:hypothetical protein GVAV_002835 [Gurleya vavrai]